MSESQYESDEWAEETRQRSPELPPVQPPSAGFIVQLFLVPGLIVLAIVGVWALFGKLAAGEQDWRTLVAEIRSSNDLRRWRAAQSLAQVLDMDRRQGEDGQKLAENREIAGELAKLLDEQLAKPSQDKDVVKQQEFLTLALGLSDVRDVAFPPLERAMHAGRKPEVRKNAMAAVSMIAFRADERNEKVDAPDVVKAVIDVSQDPESLLMRQTAAFTLGLLPSEASKERLQSMLADSDDKTRINAAIGLSRQDSTAGWMIFKNTLSEADHVYTADDVQGASDEERKQNADNRTGENLVAVKNVLKAVSDLSDKFTPEERTELIALVEPISTSHREPRIRVDAEQTLQSLQQAK